MRVIRTHDILARLHNYNDPKNGGGLWHGGGVLGQFIISLENEV